MCNMCRMDPSDVKILRQRQGAVEVSDFDEEPRMRKRGGKGYSRKARYPKTRPGCPENDYREHVYIWTSECNYEDMFFRYYGWHKEESKVCVGCGKSSGKRETEKYLRIKERRYKAMYGGPEDVVRGAPVSRYGRRLKPPFAWWDWERYDEDYKKFHNEHVIRNGLPAWLVW